MCSGPTGRCYLHWINKMFQSHSSWWNCTLVWFSMWKTIYRSGKTRIGPSFSVERSWSDLKFLLVLGRSGPNLKFLVDRHPAHFCWAWTVPVKNCRSETIRGFLQKSWTGSEQGQPNWRTRQLPIEDIIWLALILYFSIVMQRFAKRPSESLK